MRRRRTLIVYAGDADLAGEYAFIFRHRRSGARSAPAYDTTPCSDPEALVAHVHAMRPDGVLLVVDGIPEADTLLGKIQLRYWQLPVVFLAAHVPGCRYQSAQPCQLVLHRGALFDHVDHATRGKRGPAPRIRPAPALSAAS